MGIDDRKYLVSFTFWFGADQIGRVWNKPTSISHLLDSNSRTHRRQPAHQNSHRRPRLETNLIWQNISTRRVKCTLEQPIHPMALWIISLHTSLIRNIPPLFQCFGILYMECGRQ
jgi:hypothetical protein